MKGSKNINSFKPACVWVIVDFCLGPDAMPFKHFRAQKGLHLEPQGQGHPYNRIRNPPEALSSELGKPTTKH